ncbi:MAG TPA: MlaD family protein [Polyangiaceae bacterium]|nr:MlaD family protein [Polyangiaceae bacterium]
MAVATNRWKLGLFVIVGFAVALSALVVFGAQSFSKKTVEVVSFFDESVQGLDVGSPVKFRGVTVGRVSSIDIAENQRHVQVTSALSAEQVGRLKIGARGNVGHSVLHTDMRVQLAQAGITGVKFILIDFVDSKTNPVIPLPFKPPPNYIPTAPSTMKNIEDSVVKTTNRFPEIADDAARAILQIRSVAEQVEQGRLPERAGDTLAQANASLGELNRQLAALNTGQLSRDASKNLQEFNAILVRTNALLSRLDGEQGLFHNAERSADAIRDLAHNARSVGPELELTLREIRGAARSIKRLADELERDPDMLLKGRAARKP